MARGKKNDIMFSIEFVKAQDGTFSTPYIQLDGMTIINGRIQIDQTSTDPNLFYIMHKVMGNKVSGIADTIGMLRTFAKESVMTNNGFKPINEFTNVAGMKKYSATIADITISVWANNSDQATDLIKNETKKREDEVSEEIADTFYAWRKNPEGVSVVDDSGLDIRPAEEKLNMVIPCYSASELKDQIREEKAKENPDTGKILDLTNQLTKVMGIAI